MMMNLSTERAGEMGIISVNYRVLGWCHSVQFCLQKCTGPRWW